MSAKDSADDWTVVCAKGGKKGAKKGGLSLSQANRLASRANASVPSASDEHDSPDELKKK